jgi:diguanylate cyclase (GGDEF)-like protein
LIIIKLSAILTRNDCYTLVMIDLDDFKRVNDLYGPNVGDELLKSFTTNLKNTLRSVADGEVMNFC